MRTKSNFSQRRSGQHKIAFTVNLVVHRQNLDHLEEMIAFIEQLGPERVEIATPSITAGRSLIAPRCCPRMRNWKKRSPLWRRPRSASPAARIDSVVPDYYAKYPKACMGWMGDED